MFLFAQTGIVCCIVLFLVLRVWDAIEEVRFWSHLLHALLTLVVKREISDELYDQRVPVAVFRKVLPMGIVASDCIVLIVVVSAGLMNREPGHTLYLMIGFAAYLFTSGMLFFELRRRVDKKKRNEYLEIMSLHLLSSHP